MHLYLCNFFLGIVNLCCCLDLTLASVSDKTKREMKQDLRNGTKDFVQVLNELGYREKDHFR